MGNVAGWLGGEDTKSGSSWLAGEVVLQIAMIGGLTSPKVAEGFSS